jgi:hypothetical protein
MYEMKRAHHSELAAPGDLDRLADALAAPPVQQSPVEA